MCVSYCVWAGYIGNVIRGIFSWLKNQRQLDMRQIFFVLQQTRLSFLLNSSILIHNLAIQTNGNEKTSNLNILRGEAPILHSVLVDLLNQRLEVLNHLGLTI